MWNVGFESTKAQQEIEALIKAGKLTRDDQAIIAAWIRQISLHGPESIRGDYKWADHELEDEWTGYRSSAFSRRGRIIYRIEDKHIKILIARITDVHDYEKKGENKP